MSKIALVVGWVSFILVLALSPYVSVTTLLAGIRNGKWLEVFVAAIIAVGGALAYWQLAVMVMKKRDEI